MDQLIQRMKFRLALRPKIRTESKIFAELEVQCEINVKGLRRAVTISIENIVIIKYFKYKSAEHKNIHCHIIDIYK